ncbi:MULTISPECIES: hypothetical protein [Roseobacteraceae]|jgi:hypothetical protein|uniref:Uncharacterized protein n=1 Tax=Celeribacter baekdonensis B30 TaxID=1208323 RepID=K2J139_9RHOB|nr:MULTISPECIES: hypothetical protein [Roseobacteraceae]EKE68808.1 hypothetical protein B30_17355 [Celeribacter baekdonensis B30]KAB6718178.1 hypothetical protein C8029_00365 [Roseobacter sp. TSBP12]|tara:strand:- start:7070 stop:7330 length:261 start_codon:yes stop_codon:yes gene_type:complete
MSFVFDIAGHLCAADHVRMRGNTIEAEFEQNVLGALADAFDRSHKVSVLSMPSLRVTYSVQDYRSDGHGGCRATFSVNSSEGRVLH